MATYRELFDLNLMYMDYVKSKTLLIHQYLSSPSATGASVEVEVRDFLRRFIPSRFHITHGYILAAADRAVEPLVSPQVDIIIVDSLVPHSLWTIDDVQGAQLVPIEAVVGIIEVKRTLTKPALAAAIGQLQAIRDTVGISKVDKTQYLPGGIPVGDGLESPYYSNPLLGVLGVVTDAALARDPQTEIASAISEVRRDEAPDLELDIVTALDGLLVATGSPANPTNYRCHNVRDVAATYPWVENSARVGSNPRVAMARAIGFLLAYLGNACGRAANYEGYFFNNTLDQV